MSNTSNYYVNPKEFQEEYDLSLKNDEPSKKLLLMFQKIAKGYSKKYTGNKIDTDACVNYALTEAWKKWKKFDRTRSSNIFAFFTQMIKNDLAQHHNKIFKNKKFNISIDALFVNNQNK